MITFGIPVGRMKLVPKIEVVRPGSMMNALSEEEALLLKKVLPPSISTLEKIQKKEILHFAGTELWILRETTNGDWKSDREEISDDMFQIAKPPAGAKAVTGALEWLGLERISNKIEIGYFRLEGGIANPSGGVDFIHVFIMMDVEEDLILFQEIFTAAPNPRLIQKDLIQSVCRFFKSQQILPAQLFLDDPQLETALGPLFGDTGIKPCRVKSVSHLKKAVRGLNEFLKHRSD